MRPGQFQLLGHDGALGRPAALEPHLHVLFDRQGLGRPGLKELGQPGLGGVVPVGHVGAERGLVLVHVDEFLELDVLLVPALAQLLEARVPVRAGVDVGAEAAAVDPGAGTVDARFQGHDAARRVVEQLPVVADEEHGLLRVVQLRLEPALARDVEVVVRLVEEQQLVGAGEEGLEHQPLLLAAGEARRRAVLRAVERQAEGGHADLVPDGLDVVAAGVAPVHDRLCVLHLGGLVVVLQHGQLRLVDGARGGRQRGRGRGHQQVTDRGVVPDLADELAHDAHVAGPADHAFVGDEVAGDDPKQRGFARSVRPDQRGLGAVRDLEGHTVEQLGAVGEEVVDAGNVNMGHAFNLPMARRGSGRRFPA